MNTIKQNKEIDLVVSLNDLKKLTKNQSEERFELVPFVDENKVQDPLYLKDLKTELFTKLPFYEGLLFNKRSGSIRSAIYLDKKIVNLNKEIEK